MAGIVVRVPDPAHAGAVLRWAESEARRRGATVTFVHVWDEPIEIETDLPAGTLPDLGIASHWRVGPGRPEVRMLADDPELVVLPGAALLDRQSRAVMHHARCPVVLVPAQTHPPVGRVVVGVCGTPASQAALLVAVGQSRSMAAELVVVQAWQRPFRLSRQTTAAGGQGGADDVAASDRLRDWVGREIDTTGVRLRSVHGPPLESLLCEADSADLLVVGQHLHGHLGQVLHGTIGTDVGRLALCPVMIVPG